MNYVYYDGWRILLLLSSFSVPSVICCLDFIDVKGDVDVWGGFVGKRVLSDGVDVTVVGEAKSRNGWHGEDHWKIKWILFNWRETHQSSLIRFTQWHKSFWRKVVDPSVHILDI